MKTIASILFVAASAASPVDAGSKSYPPIAEYLLPRENEIALARSAAPAAISQGATVKVLTAKGYVVAEEGRNGSVCLVMRGFTAPTYTPVALRDVVYDPSVHAPICFTPEAARVVMPYYELRTALAMQGRSPDEIAAGVEAAYANGTLPARSGVTFAYMWSAHQHLGDPVGAWRPHVMVFAPYYRNAMLGDHPFGSPLPQVADDAGTPFSVVVIPVDPALSIALPARAER